jgi:5-carboxymethyl-2-hydroxymuconate isomerase
MVKSRNEAALTRPVGWPKNIWKIARRQRGFKEEAMPHVIVEYSANIEADITPQRLVEDIHSAAITSGIAEPVAVRTRLMRREHYRVGDGAPENAFVHIDIRARKGRSLEQKKAMVQAIYDQANKTLDVVFKARPLALTVEIHEIDPDTRLLRNGMRERKASGKEATAA